MARLKMLTENRAAAVMAPLQLVGHDFLVESSSQFVGRSHGQVADNVVDFVVPKE